MRYRMAAIAAAALLCTISAVSCGKSSDDSSSVTVKVGNTTEASTETASSTEKTTEKTSTTAEKTTEATTGEDTTEAVTEEKTTEAETSEVKATEAVTTQPQATEAPTAPKPSSSSFAADRYLGNVISDIKDVLGEPAMSYTAEACLPIGDDGNAYIYDFSGVKAECYLQNEEHYIDRVTIESSKYSTPEGITVGSSKSDVEAAYGSASVQGNGDLEYNKGTYYLYFTMNGDSVSEIEYTLNY